MAVYKDLPKRNRNAHSISKPGVRSCCFCFCWFWSQSEKHIEFN